jgi:prolycopene isomerase
MSKMELIPHMLKKLKYAIPFLKYLRYAGSEGVVKGLNTFFKDEKLLKVFASEMDMLSCLVPIGWAYYGDYQLPPTGGSQVFPEWLEYATRSMGNDVFYRCKVSQVRTNNGKVVGVDLEHKGHTRTVMCEHVVAACDVETLYEKMLPANATPEKLKAKLRNAELYSSSVTVSLALNCPAEQLGFDEEMIYLSRDEVSREEQANGDPFTNGISILAPSLRDPSMAPENAGTLTLYVPAFFDQYEYWGTELDESGKRLRGDEYKRIKNWYADIIIDRVAKRFAPNLRKHIVYSDVATPITHWRYSGNRNGSMMGARPGEANFKAKIAHYNTPVENLILSGHWAELGGGVPVAVKAAANTALLVMQKQKPEAARIWADYMVGKATLQDAASSGTFVQYKENWIRDLTPAEKLQIDKVA